MGGLVMGNSFDVPAIISPADRPADATSRMVGLDGENVDAGGETSAAADAATLMPSVTDINVVQI